MMDTVFVKGVGMVSGFLRESADGQGERVMVNVIALEWTEPKPPTKGESSYDHCQADTPIGQYEIMWQGWKDEPGFIIHLDGKYIASRYSLDDAKQTAASHFREIVARCLDPGELPPLRK
jgi:hypothetical protein